MASCSQPWRRQRARGFAYLWTLLMVAFMGVGLTIAGDLYATAARRDQERELLFIGHEFRNAIASYYKANGRNQYPQTLDELLKDPRFAGATRHLRRLYADPVTGKAEWALVLLQGRIVGVHSLSARQPIKQDNFEDDDAGLRLKARYADWVFTYPHDLFIPPENGATPTPGPAPNAAPGGSAMRGG
ncbi:type II secretion system protein [Rugamonas brunnea]|uniref:type II secretion system protein n=1 Tax=Rugamonas brunnea TaxID=2758569 RepID=UPI001E2B7266|nr:type II secretion system protein [Rugamonas brunnea]